jgi:murein DD-endopeptidase MepM/ murein hydrolase activator NlpD
VRRLTHAAAAVAIAVALAAAGCAKGTEPVRRTGSDVFLRIEAEIFEARVPPHATLETLLRDHELPAELVQAAVESARAVFNPRHIRADQPYRLVRSVDGFLREFIYEIDTDRFLRIVNPDREEPARLAAEVLPFDKETAILAIRGRIDSDRNSLIAAIDGTGENVQLAMALAEIFGGQIDFNSELQPGDTFEVLFEKSTRDEQFAGYGAILAASFSNDGKTHQAFRWVSPKSGKAGYYDENGRSLKRFFLMSPLKFEPRITSRFSRRRFHPVHRTYRAHLGVDYGAPRGAPVVAVAAGVVVSAGWAGGGGNQVRIRHAGGFETYYLHLSRFAKGIRRGARVTQGKVIGFVGSTGTATGPHLDFRLRRNGVFVDPVRERRRQPPGEPIPADYLETFRSARDAMLRDLTATLLAEAPAVKPDAVSTAQ